MDKPQNTNTGMSPLSEQAANPRRKRLRIIIGVTLAVVTVLLIGICGAFASVAPEVIRMNFKSPTPDIKITGTIEKIAGMPIPADGILTGQTMREKGGTFDYRTTLRPKRIYEFYVALLTLRGAWLAGSHPVLTDNSAVFRFYTPFLPRLTIITVNCDSQLCQVHVDY